MQTRTVHVRSGGRHLLPLGGTGGMSGTRRKICIMEISPTRDGDIQVSDRGVLNTTHLCSAQDATLSACTIVFWLNESGLLTSLICVPCEKHHRVVRHVLFVISFTDLDTAARCSTCTASSTTTTSRTRLTRSRSRTAHSEQRRSVWSLGRTIPAYTE